MSNTQPTAAVCEVDNCGVQAVGGCAICGRAFCPTHQGYTFNNFYQRIPYLDSCSPCADAKQVEETKRQAEAQEKAHAPSNYFDSGAAQTDLLTSGVQPVNIYNIQMQWRKNGFFDRGRYIDVAFLRGRGWILGNFKGKYHAGLYEGIDIFEDWLTVLMDKPFMRLSAETQSHKGLVRVQPCTGGYQELSSSWDNYFNWQEVMEAVKRLTGASS